MTRSVFCLNRISLIALMRIDCKCGKGGNKSENFCVPYVRDHDGLEKGFSRASEG